MVSTLPSGTGGQFRGGGGPPSPPRLLGLSLAHRPPATSVGRRPRTAAPRPTVWPAVAVGLVDGQQLTGASVTAHGPGSVDPELGERSRTLPWPTATATSAPTCTASIPRSAAVMPRTCCGPSSSRGWASAGRKGPTAVRRRSPKVGPAAQRRPQVGGQATDVGARRAVHGDGEDRSARRGGRRRSGLAVDVEAADLDPAGRPVDLDALPGQLVQPAAADLDGRDHGRDLADGRRSGRPGGLGGVVEGRHRSCPSGRSPRRCRRGWWWPPRARPRRCSSWAGRSGSAAAGWPARGRRGGPRWRRGRGCPRGRPASDRRSCGTGPRRRGWSSPAACPPPPGRRAGGRPAGRAQPTRVAHRAADLLERSSRTGPGWVNPAAKRCPPPAESAGDGAHVDVRDRAERDPHPAWRLLGHAGHLGLADPADQVDQALGLLDD